jgi:PAS domain S-box-containing protein
MKNLFFAVAFLLFLSCEEKEKESNGFPAHKSFKDIPGITAQEIAAIEALQKEKETFNYGMTLNTETFLTKSGEIDGFSSLFCKWLSNLFGIPFKPAIYERSSLLAGLESAEIDFTGDLTITDERRKTHFMTGTIAERLLKAFKIEGTPPIADIAKSRSLRLAITQGFALLENVKKISDYAFEPVFVNNHDEAYNAIKNGEADAYLTMNVAELALDKYRDVVSETFYPLVFASTALSTQNPNLAPVISVVQKALENGGVSYLAGLYILGNHDYIKNKFIEHLTIEEREYIQRNAVVKVATESDSYPLSFYNKNDKELQGIAFDMMKELELITGISFEIVSPLNANFLTLTNMVESGEASMITTLMRSKERERSFLLPGTPIMKEYPLLVSKSEFPNVQFNELSNVTVGIVRGTLYAELFKRWFPNNKIFKEYGSMDSAFNALVHGEVDMFMCMSNYLLSITNYKELVGYKANVVFDNYFDITFGFNKNEVILYSIIDKALRLIDMETISRYWTRKTYDYRAKIAEARLPWIIGAATLSLVIFALMLTMFYRSHNSRKQKEADAKVNEADTRTKIMFDIAPFAGCMFDKDFNMIDCNQELVKMFGIPDKKYFLTRHIELFPEYQPNGTLSSEAAAKNVSIALEKGYHNFECMHQKLSGEPLPVKSTLVCVKYRGETVIASYFTDLTEQKAKEQLTKIVTEKSTTLTAILDTTPDLIFCKDLNSRYTLCNKGFEDLLNIRREDIIGKDDIEGLKTPPEIAEAFIAEDKKIFSQRQVVMFENYLLSHDGKQILFETIKSPLIIDGKVTGVVGIARNITQRKEMAKQQAEAEAANKAKSSFLATMSHEIRTPMNAILGITEIQLQNEELSLDTRNALNIIYNSGYSLLNIINDLLDLSKIEAGKLELINDRYEMASLINDTVNLNTTRIGSKPIEFKLQVDKDLPLELIGDELRVKQILNNLLSNAFKYTDKGEVSLSFSAETAGEKATLAITVRDTGHGMTEEQVQNLFDAYARFNIKANRFVEGTGLGMNIAQHLANAMGGKISVNSKPSKGTEVTVHLTQGYAGSAKLGNELAESLMKFRLPGISKIKKAQIVREHMPYGRVLVVDDMETNLYVAKGFLLPYELTVETALSGREAIEKIKRGNAYDIVFMDHMMPVMDGIETVKILRESGYARPIIALTANAVSGQADVFMENGFDGFISKPIDIRELNASLNKFVRDKQPQIDPELAKIFIRDAEKAASVLQSYETDNLQMYIISVHALKSALANIGETKLSGFARELETAGKDRNIDFISKETSAFLSELQAVVDKLKPGNAEHAGEVSNEDLAYLRKMLLAIKDACAAYNINAATAALKELKQKSWPNPYGELLDAISAHLLQGDFDEAKAVCDMEANKL